MATSDVSICNLGLVRCGSDPVIISSLNEDSAEARACNAVYTQRRDSLLAMGPWGFATAHVTLALVRQNPNTDWAYEYEYPNDCLAFQRILNPAGRESEPIKFQRGRNVAGKNVIWTNLEFAVGEIIQRVTDPNRFSPDFSDTLSWSIAVDVCVPLTHSEKILTFCTRGYNACLSNALKNNLAESEQGTGGARIDWLEAR